jgi:hypothetical protein
MYKLMPNNLLTNQPSNVVYRIQDETWIPFDPANTDYQAYLKWVAEGNEPLPADEELA